MRKSAAHHQPFGVFMLNRQEDYILAVLDGKKHRNLKVINKKSRGNSDALEHKLQMQMAEYLSVSLISPGAWFSSVENSTQRGDTIGRIQQINRKKRGCKTGIPDIIVQYSNGYAVGVLWLEVKTKAGIVKDEQLRCHAELRAAGAIVEVVRSVKEVEDVLARYGIPHRAKVVA
jgi:hypothetical protein